MYSSTNGTITLTLGFVLMMDSAVHLTVIELLKVNVVYALVDTVEVLFNNSFKGLEKIACFLLCLLYTSPSPRDS